MDYRIVLAKCYSGDFAAAGRAAPARIAGYRPQDLIANYTMEAVKRWN